MAIVTDGLVLYLHGACGKNNPATRVWKDLSGNGNDGQLMNFDFTEDSGWVDGGLRFDGVDDRVDISPDFDFGTDSFTIEIMSKHYDYEYPLTNFAIRHNNLSFREGERGFQIGYGHYSGGVNVLVNDGTNLIRGIIGKTPELNEKVHAIFVFDRKNGNILYFYDGELVGELDISEITGDIKHSNLICIGFAAGWRPNMSLYSFRLYNRALTDEEILQNYQAGHEWTPVKGKREATTTMKPITSELSRKGTGKRELISTMKPITTSLERKGKGKREVISTMKPITASLSRKGVGKREVTTTVKPITSSISKKLPPIHANITAKERTPNVTTRERIPKLEVD